MPELISPSSSGPHYMANFIKSGKRPKLVSKRHKAHMLWLLLPYICIYLELGSSNTQEEATGHIMNFKKPVYNQTVTCSDQIPNKQTKYLIRSS